LFVRKVGDGKSFLGWKTDNKSLMGQIAIISVLEKQGFTGGVLLSGWQGFPSD
jgi:hypothetical protein